MSSDQKVAYVIATAAVLNAKVAGMQAMNDRCRLRGCEPTYGDDAFAQVIDEAGLDHNALVVLFQES